MTGDPAELIFFRSLTNDRFFAEARRLGLSDEQLRDGETYDRVFRSCLIALRSEIVQAVAEGLGIPVSEEQARTIGLHSLVPQVIAEPAPLSPEERRIALELYYHAVKAAAARHATPVSERAARAAARRMVRSGERGLSFFEKYVGAWGCLPVLVAALTATLGAGAAGLAASRGGAP
jgi:hypothetical protein